jgi:D-ribose pyranase
MYKNAILNSSINRIAGELGHTDRICIADCGLPIPREVEKVDLALKPGSPGFFDVLTEIALHLEIERVIVASEITEHNAQLYEQLKSFFKDIPIELVPHTEFKQKTTDCVAVIRTGEAAPYANVILQAGCLF